MTDELQELEPLEEATPELTPDDGLAPDAAGAEEAPVVAAARGPAPGLPAPAFNPLADKEYYRFLFAGVVMFIGCLMPFGPDWEMAGYKTLSGAFATWVAIGTIWSWWSAISTARFSGANLKWVLFALVVFIVQLMGLLKAGDLAAVVDYKALGKIPTEYGWGNFFGDFFNLNDAVAQNNADHWIRAIGAGKVVVLIGALLSELFMIQAIFGGAKTAKAQKAAKAAKRRR